MNSKITYLVRYFEARDLAPISYLHEKKRRRKHQPDL